jgi:hypothetical protein
MHACLHTIIVLRLYLKGNLLQVTTFDAYAVCGEGMCNPYLLVFSVLGLPGIVDASMKPGKAITGINVKHFCPVIPRVTLVFLNLGTVT